MTTTVKLHGAECFYFWGIYDSSQISIEIYKFNALGFLLQLGDFMVHSHENYIMYLKVDLYFRFSPIQQFEILSQYKYPKFFFASSPWKLVTNYVLEWMGLNFQYHDGLQPKIRGES